MATDPLPKGSLDLEWSRERYRGACERVIDYIEQGDVYQVNLTMPARIGAPAGVSGFSCVGGRLNITLPWL
ncbi:hypothetical protein [Sphingobium sp. 15-1]|uniref:hypothetical protein n=1 Tax=Sphingobium sp. 15-1 TaxID=2729616 RepID=UPI00159C69CD|nr:hypothetical protein [Sphingobium sp. 15-1]